MRIQHNISALNAHRQLGGNQTSIGKNLEKLSSGFRINRAGDDAAGLAISEKMRSQIKGLETASKNAQDGISLVQTAEGALTEVHSMLNRMTELATQSANGTYDEGVDRANLQKELDSLRSEVDRIAGSTNFNGINLLDGSLGGGKGGKVGESSFTGGEIAKFTAASQKGMGNTDLTDIDTAATGKDYFSVDGQRLEIDWTKGDAATLATALDKDFDTTAMSAEEMKDMAGKLTDLFNDAMQEQGLKGSIKFTSNGTNIFAESLNKGSKSEFSFTGTEKPGAGTAATSVGSAIFGNTASNDAVISKAGATYNGETITSGSKFQMDINGVKVGVTVSGISKGATMASGATKLETAIKAAVAQYNTDMGLTAGAKDADSGLTGLTAADFTVTATVDGEMLIKYAGDVENTSFKFNDVGEKSVAASLGLATGNSSAGGGRGLTLQVGDTGDQTISVTVGNMNSKSLGIDAISIGNQSEANDAIAVIKDAINSVSSTRGNLGAIQNRLEHTINNLGVTAENMTAAESRIRDVDMAKEMMEFTKNNILSQAATSMLAQANQTPQGVLQLLQ